MKKFAKRVLPMILIMALLAAMMTVPVAAGQDKTYLFNKTGNVLEKLNKFTACYLLIGADKLAGIVFDGLKISELFKETDI